MPSEWVGVVGTAIGAGIGGVVTVASLIVKGRQDGAAEKLREAREDKRREEDRRWEIRRTAVDERREVYRDLLDTAEEFITSTIDFVERSDRPPQKVEQARDRAIRAFIKMKEAATTVNLVAPDPEVPGVVWRIIRTAAPLGLSGEWPDVWLDHRTSFPSTEFMRLQTELAMACRRDLAYEVPPSQVNGPEARD
jgi:hypothetical protein